MLRREFLKRGSALACAAAAMPIGGALRGEEPASPTGGERAAEATSPVRDRVPGSKFKLSLAAYSFRAELGKGEMSLEDFIDLCAAERLDATELTSYYFPSTDRDYLLSLRRRAYVNGLAISGTPIGCDFCHPPGEKRDEQMAHVRSWIDHVAILGSQTIRIFAGSTPKGDSEAEARARAIDGMREASAYAGERGVLLALENHGGITSTVDRLLGLVQAVDSPWLGVNLDTGNFHENVYESLAKAARWAVAVQVKVMTHEGKEAPRETDWERIARILDEAQYRGYVALEYEEKEDARTAVPRHLATLRKVLAS